MTSAAFSVGRRIFVDSSAYYAVSDLDDANHERAAALLHQLVAARRSTFTTNYVIAESHALHLSRLGYQAALRWLTGIVDDRATVIVRVSLRDEHRARDIIRAYDDKTFSLSDATSFAVMERLRISQAFSFDADFRQFGFVTLPERH